MSTHDNHHDHNTSVDGDAEHDLSSNGILEAVRSDEDIFEPRSAFDRDCTSPSPPPAEGGRFFLGSSSVDGSETEASGSFSPNTPDISISNADDHSLDNSRSGRDSYASDLPSEFQARGPHDPYNTPADGVPPTIRHFGSFGTLSGIYNGTPH